MLRRTRGWLAVLGVLAVGAATSGCVEPADRRPGLRLSGALVEEAIEDWSFSAAHREIYVETRTPYWIPHSVTIVCADADGELFIGARDPEQKRWVRWVERDPEVRLKIGEQIYEVRLERMLEASTLERIRAAYASKLGRPMETNAADAPPNVWYWKVSSRS